MLYWEVILVGKKRTHNKISLDYNGITNRQTDQAQAWAQNESERNWIILLWNSHDTHVKIEYVFCFLRALVIRDDKIWAAARSAVLTRQVFDNN